MGEQLLVLDTASLYFRAFYGVPASLRTPAGIPVNAVRGLLDFISALVTDFRPTALVAAWDEDWRPAFRVALIPTYKTHRLEGAAAPGGSIAEAVPPDLAPQVKIIEQLLPLLGIPIIGVPGFEADDVIGTLAAQATGPVDIVTGDRDLFQLIDDSRGIRVFYTAVRGVRNAQVCTEETILAKYGVAPQAYADMAILRGDPADGLPGIAGIGEKTAVSLISRFGDIDSVLAAAADPRVTGITARQRQNLLDGADYIDRAKAVVRVTPDLAVPDFPATLPRACPNPTAIAAAAKRFGLESSLVRISAAFGWDGWASDPWPPGPLSGTPDQ